MLADGYDKTMFGVTGNFEVRYKTDSDESEWLTHSDNQTVIDGSTKLECVTKFDDENLIAVGFNQDWETVQKNLSLNFYNIEKREWTIGNSVNIDFVQGRPFTTYQPCFMLNELDLVYTTALDHRRPTTYIISTIQEEPTLQKIPELQEVSYGYHFRGSKGQFMIDYDGAHEGNQTLLYLLRGQNEWSDLQVQFDTDFAIFAGCFL